MRELALHGRGGMRAGCPQHALGLQRLLDRVWHAMGAIALAQAGVPQMVAMNLSTRTSAPARAEAEPWQRATKPQDRRDRRRAPAGCFPQILLGEVPEGGDIAVGEQEREPFARFERQDAGERIEGIRTLELAIEGSRRGGEGAHGRARRVSLLLRDFDVTRGPARASPLLLRCFNSLGS